MNNSDTSVPTTLPNINKLVERIREKKGEEKEILNLIEESIKSTKNQLKSLNKAKKKLIMES